MRLRDREDRGFPSPLLLPYTSSSFLPSLPCRSRCRWQGDADTSQSLPLSDERLLPPSRLTLLFNVCLTFLAVLFLSHISFCLVFCFSWWTFPFHFSFLFGQYFILFGGFLSNHSPLSLFLRMIEIGMMRDCHDVGKSYDNSLYGAHWFNHCRQKLALLKAKMHRVSILRQYVNHSRDDEKKTLQAMLQSLASVLWLFTSQWLRICERDHSEW